MSLPAVSAARATVESAFVDICRITRDSPGPRDDVLDRTTGKLVPPVADETPVYGPGVGGTGACWIRALTNLQGQRRTEGNRDVDRQEWRVRLPVSSPLIRHGDIFVALSCQFDPTLVGRRLVVVKVEGSTMAISRILTLQDEKAATRV